MYDSFYGLNEKPFSILPDSELIYWGRSHRLAYAMLEYGVRNNAGFTVITGDIGTGKTMLVRHLLKQIDEKLTVGLVANTARTSRELLRWVMLALGQPHDDQSYITVYRRFQDFVVNEYNMSRRTVLIIDEAQNMSAEALEELRMLSNINADKQQYLQIVLVGQPQLKDLLQRPELVQFAQRVSSDFHLKPLPEDEVTDYIYHRLYKAGCRTALFSGKACKLIAKHSRGVPRSINILADTALVYGYSAEAKQITAEIVQAVMTDRRQYSVFSAQDAAAS